MTNRPMSQTRWHMASTVVNLVYLSEMSLRGICLLTPESQWATSAQSVSCDDNGKWSSENIHCIEILCCLLLSQQVNTTSVSVDTIVNIVCLDTQKMSDNLMFLMAF